MAVEAAKPALGGFAHGMLLKARAPAGKGDVEDVLSDAYVDAATRLRRDPEYRVEDMVAWFRRFVFWRCIKKGRLTRWERLRFVPHLEEQEEMLEMIDGGNTSLDVHIAMREAYEPLTDDEQKLTALILAGRTSEEIAEADGVSVVAARKRKSRLFNKLRTLLGGITWLK